MDQELNQTVTGPIGPSVPVQQLLEVVSQFLFLLTLTKAIEDWFGPVQDQTYGSPPSE